jgi:hypothetical protein
MRMHLVALIVGCVAACGQATASAGTPQQAPPPDNPVDPTIADGSAQRRLDAARARWEAAGLSSYRMRVQRICFCGPKHTRPATVLVRDGKPVRPPERVRYGASVPRLFKRIQEAIDHRFSGLEVRYGARGVPRRVELDPVELISDEEMTFVVDHVRPLR